MNGKDVNRYLTLLDRKLFIVAHSGVEWKPEYGPEMEAIDQELVELRKLVDQEHGRGRRMEKEVQMKAFASESDFDEPMRSSWRICRRRELLSGAGMKGWSATSRLI